MSFRGYSTVSPVVYPIMLRIYNDHRGAILRND